MASSSLAFLFGNVDENGQLADLDEADEDLRVALTSLSTGKLGAGILSSELLSEATAAAGSSRDATVVRKAANAVDYGDTNELVEDAAGDAAAATKTAAAMRPLFAKDVFANLRGPAPAAAAAAAASASSAASLAAQESAVTVDALREHFPQFRHNKVLRFVELFAPSGRRRRIKQMRLQKHQLSSSSSSSLSPLPSSSSSSSSADENVELHVEYGTEEDHIEAGDDAFPQTYEREQRKRRLDAEIHHEFARKRKASAAAAGADRVVPAATATAPAAATSAAVDNKLLVADLRHWEDSVIWDDRFADALKQVRAHRIDPNIYLPWTLDTFRWEDKLLGDAYDSDNDNDLDFEQTVPIVIDLNDPNMLFEMDKNVGERFAEATKLELENPAPPEPKKPKAILTESVLTGPLGETIDFYNISNDKHYEFSKKSERVRHGISRLSLRHTTPALQLEYPLFKTHFSKSELRQFHRPLLHVHGGMVLPMQLPKELNKKKLKKNKKLGVQLIQNPSDISLLDQCEFVLLEYSEEFPPLMMNAGMGTLIQNYYRKTLEKDSYVPEAKYGAPAVLERVDKSPFAEFGDIKPAQTMPVLVNTLFRAPLFQHQPPSTLFLLVMQKNKLTVHEVPALFLVGQTFPQVEVPTPNSRKAHMFVKQRIDAYITREFRRKDNIKKRVAVDVVYESFPFLAQSNLRKKLSPIADVKRRPSDNVAFWYLKPSAKLPTEDELRKLIPPEAVCAYESMLFAQQRLKDLGYLSSVVSMEDNEDDDEGDKVDDEVKLAPWRVTKNVVNAFQSKGRLELTGSGDPTGRGEGFSFIRVPSRANHSKTQEPAAQLLKSSTVAGTDSDLRRMSVQTARQILRNTGMSEPEIAVMTRWHLIRAVRALANSGAQSGEGDLRYVRQSRHSLNENKRAYNEDMQRIWNAQHTALSSKDDIPDDDDDDDEDMLDLLADLEEDPQGGGIKSGGADGSAAATPSAGTADGAAAAPATPSAATTGSSQPASPAKGPQIKRLRIQRKIQTEDGQVETEVEDITDPHVIQAYLAARERIPQKKAPSSRPRPAPTTNVDPQTIADRKERRRLQDQQRRARKRAEAAAALASGDPDAIAALQASAAKSRSGGASGGGGGKKPTPMSGNPKLRCSQCGQVGHIRTHKLCPKNLERQQAQKQSGGKVSFKLSLSAEASASSASITGSNYDDGDDAEDDYNNEELDMEQ